MHLQSSLMMMIDKHAIKFLSVYLLAMCLCCLQRHYYNNYYYYKSLIPIRFVCFRYFAMKPEAVKVVKRSPSLL